MPYVERDNAAIVGLFAQPQPGYAEEWLEDNDAEVFDFQSNLAPLTRISKNAIWERATELESVAMRQMLNTQPVRTQEIYNGATHIETSHDLYPTLMAGLTQLFGAQRAEELLAPTE